MNRKVRQDRKENQKNLAHFAFFAVKKNDVIKA